MEETLPSSSMNSAFLSLSLSTIALSSPSAGRKALRVSAMELMIRLRKAFSSAVSRAAMLSMMMRSRS